MQYPAVMTAEMIIVPRDMSSQVSGMLESNNDGGGPRAEESSQINASVSQWFKMRRWALMTQTKIRFAKVSEYRVRSFKRVKAIGKLLAVGGSNEHVGKVSFVLTFNQCYTFQYSHLLLVI